MKSAGVKIGLLINLNNTKLKDGIKRFVLCALRVLRGGPLPLKNPEDGPFRGTGGRRTLMVYEGGTNGCSRAGNTRVDSPRSATSTPAH